jgi:hypothetical protein
MLQVAAGSVAHALLCSGLLEYLVLNPVTSSQRNMSFPEGVKGLRQHLL